jgi:uncharacterized protein YqgV (UPF0045/DUF77 family)
MADSTAAKERMGLQFSIYPLRQTSLGAPIRAAVNAAAEAGVEVAVGKLSTFATADEDRVFAALRAAFTAAKAFGSTVMIVTLTSGVPDEHTLADIQAGALQSLP